MTDLGRMRPRRRMVVSAAAAAAVFSLVLGMAGPAAATSGPPATQSLGSGLIAGGAFETAGQVTANNIAHWNGVAWSALTGAMGTGTNANVSDLALYNGDLIAAGGFSFAGGQLVRGIARWDGNEWFPLGSGASAGVNASVFTVAVHDGFLYAGGQFTEAGGVPGVNFIARWDGTAWSALSGPAGTGVSPGIVWDLTVYDGDLVAAGSFTTAGGVTTNGVARWDGTQWSSLGLDAQDNHSILAVGVYGGDLIVPRTYAENNFTVREVLRFDGTTWSQLHGPTGLGPNADIRTVTEHDGDLYVGGNVTQIGGVTVNHIARWDGSTWSALVDSGGSVGTNLLVQETVSYDGDLVAGGLFTQAGGVAVNRIARWDGSDWAPFGDGVSSAFMGGQVMSLLVVE